ncbi:MAG: DNA polymerase III subunit gamma/tau [Arcobacter sp.]|nr:MAG: DNA polymerase III subunit gamma/tau [Arcobacter sp.]
MSDNQTAEKKVLALKYRPKRFEDLVGQSTISQTLSLALDSNRLSHAYLFSGLRGSGKTSTARIMAKALLCTEGPTSRPCDVCENCKSANTNRHLDIIEMDAASNRGIDDIKDLIEHTKYKPSSARFKVFIIDEVHMLTTQAFNALLKTLEEPPGFVKFILATTDALKLPATILSRTQHFRFNKIASQDVIHHLSHILNEENINFETPALEILTRSGQGSLRDTLTLLDQAIIFSKGEVSTTAVVDMLGLIEPKLMDELFEVILKKEDIVNLVKKLENYEISQVCDEMTIYLKEKMLEKDAKFDLLLFDRFFRILSDAKYLLALNSDGGFVLILTLSKMIEATNLKTIEDIINQVEQAEVKPVIKEAISPAKVVEHAKNDVNHAYDDEIVPLNKESHQNKKQVNEPVVENFQDDVDFEQETTISIDSINAIPTVQPIETVEENGFSTPFDEVPENAETKSEIVTQTIIETPVEKEEIQEEIKVEEEPKIEVPEVQDPNKELYKKLTEKVYERDYELGELFEKNFIYSSFEDKKLEIISHALGDDRKFLLKHYGVIKIFIYDVYGNDVDIEFKKVEEKEETSVKKYNFQSQVEEKPAALEENSDESGSMIEDIEMGSGCVADMQKTANPTASQQELQMNDILNSPMLNRAKELFDIKKITVKTKT